MEPPRTIDSTDDAVIATNDDASESKRFAINLGYWNDPYAKYFHTRLYIDRKAPEINRGYFARVKSVEMCVENILKKTDGNCQIINLGCGFDTLYYRLHAAKYKVKNFIDFDFPTVVARKCSGIVHGKVLASRISREGGPVTLGTKEIHGPNYHIMGVDLRNIDEVENRLQQAEIDYTLPTLFLAECVLVYIELQSSNNLLKWIASKFSNAVFINYEQVNMNDRFGEVMLNNLRSRGCTLGGVDACRSLDTQMGRFLECGWSGSRAWDMVQVYESIPAEERQRVERIEMLDENELLLQLFQHYCLVISWIGEMFQDIEITNVNVVEKRMSSLNID